MTTDKQKNILLKNGFTEVQIAKMSYEEVSKCIGEILNKDRSARINPQAQKAWDEKVEKIEYNKPKSDTSSYYVAYAKDLCVAMLAQQATFLDKGLIKSTDQLTDVGTMMSQAIICIKGARKEFE